MLLPLLGVPLAGGVLDGVLKAFEESAGIAKEGAEGVGAVGEASSATLQQHKATVADSLRSLRKPVVVVLDDVDRLTRDEIRLLLQLIKANADFPNIIYLLLAQRESVVEALESIAPGRGDAFLEKIVQVAFNVPAIGRKQLESILFAGLDGLLSDAVISKRFDQEQWAEIYPEGIDHFFSNLRDINRYLSALTFHVGVFRTATSFEVNPVDLFGIEVLRVFVPTLYNALPSAKDLLTDQPRFWRKEHQKEDAERLQHILKLAPEKDRAAAQKIIEVLFPPSASLLGGSYFSNGGNDWFVKLRISSHEVFDRYFHFATPEGDISQAELDQVIENLGDKDTLREKLAELSARGLLDVLLDRLDSYATKLPLEHAVPFLTVLFELNVDGTDEFFAAKFSPRTHLLRIVHWYLRQEPDHGKRKSLLRESLENTSGLIVPASLLSWLRPEKESDPDALLPSAGDMEEIKRVVMGKIQAAAASGELGKCDELGTILWTWWRNGERKDLQVWVATHIETDAGLLHFVSAMKNVSVIYSGVTRKEKPYFKPSDIAELVDLETLKGRVATLDQSKLSVSDAEHISLLQRDLSPKNDGAEED